MVFGYASFAPQVEELEMLLLRIAGKPALVNTFLLILRTKHGQQKNYCYQYLVEKKNSLQIQ